jgi:hypothetical protein
LLSGEWKVPSLINLGKWRKNIIFTFFHFPPNKFYFNFPPLILRFYFIMVLNHYFTSFLPFPQPINYNHASGCTKFSTHSLPNWFWLKIFFSLNSWHRAWPCVTSLKLQKWMKNRHRNHPYIWY